MLHTLNTCLCVCSHTQGSLLSETMGEAGCWLPKILWQWEGNNRYVHIIITLVTLTRAVKIGQKIHLNIPPKKKNTLVRTIQASIFVHYNKIMFYTLLLNYKLISVWPAFYFQSMKLMLCAQLPVDAGPRGLEDFNVETGGIPFTFHHIIWIWTLFFMYLCGSHL